MMNKANNILVRWTQLHESKHFYVIIKRDIFLYQIIERIAEFETEMEIPDKDRWTKGKVLKGNEFEHVYELIQRLGELESDIPKYRQRKKIHEKINKRKNNA